jgi:hypothetical protein
VSIIITDAPSITRDNACEALDALLTAERDLAERMRTADSPAARAALYRQAADNALHQARAWEVRPGAHQYIQSSADNCRYQARVSSVAARLEELRADALERGRPDLPDPALILAGSTTGSGPALEALVELYTAAASGPAIARM